MIVVDDRDAIADSTTYVCSPSVVDRTEEDGALLVHLGTRHIHRVSPLAYEVFKRCEAGDSLGEIARDVSSKLGIEMDDVLRSLNGFISELEDRRILKKRTGDG